MTSDYLKQLQLTKQLEAKARQATKERKTAESRLAEAEKEVGSAREEGYDVSGMEDLYVQAAEAFSKRNHDLVLSLCDRSHAALLELKRERALSIADGIRSILSSLSEEKGIEISGLLDQVASLAGEGRSDEALALASDAREKAERHAAEQLAGLMARANELIDLAGSLGLPVKGARKLLDETEKLNGGAMTREGVGGSISLVLDAFSKHFDNRRKKIDAATAGAEQAGLQLADLRAIMDSAASSMNKGEVEAALEMLDDADARLPDILSRAAEERMADLRADALTVRDLGGDVSAFERESARAGKAAGRKVLAPLRKAAELLQEARAGVLMDAIAALRPRMVLAHRLQLDISPALAALDEARQALLEQKLELSLDKVAETEQMLEGILEGHYGLAAELRRIQELFHTARRIGLPPGPASQLVADSREQALAGDIEAASSLLAEAREGLHDLLQDAGSRRALSGLYMLSQAVTLGAEVEQVREDLLTSLEELRKGEVNGTVASLDDLSSMLRTLSEDTARERVESTRRRLFLFPSSLELSDLSAKLDKAEGLLASGELLGAVGLAGEVDDQAKRRQKAAVDIVSARAARLLDISHQLGAGSATLDQKMMMASRPVDPGEKIAILSDVIAYTAELVKNELTSSLARLYRDISAARKNGVSVARAERLSEDALAELRKGDWETSFALHNESRNELEKMAGLHAEVYDRIVLLSRMMNDARLPAKHIAHARLEETKRLFELGKYDGARVSGQECLRELEEAASAALAPRRLKEVRDVAALTASLEIEHSKLEAELRRAEELHRRGRNDETLALLHGIEQDAAETLHRGLREQVDDTSVLLDKCEMMGCDVAGSRDILDKAGELLKESRYLDAFRAVRFAAEEGRRALAHVRSVQAEVGRTELLLEEAIEAGVRVEEAAPILEQARKDLMEDRHTLALERCRMARELIGQAAGDRIDPLLDEIESENALDELVGEDLRQEGIDRQAVKKALEQGPRWAFRMADRYRRTLEELNSSRSRAQAALDAADRDDAGPARAAFSRGAFMQCLALLAPSSTDRHVLASHQQRRSAALDLLRKLFEGADVDGSGTLSSMKDAPPERFWELYGQALEALRRSGEERRMEEVGGLVDALRALLLLQPDEVSEQAKHLLSCPLHRLTPTDLALVPTIVEEAGAAIGKRLKAMGGGGGDASGQALQRADLLLSKGELTLSARAVQEADRSRGWAAEGRKAMWERYDSLVARVAELEERGADMQEVRNRLRGAMDASPERSKHALDEAQKLLAEEERVLSPSIRLDVISEKTGANGWKRLSVALINSGGTAADLRTEAEGGEVRADLPSILPPGRLSAEIEVKDARLLRFTYRPLFSRRTEVANVVVE